MRRSTTLVLGAGASASFGFPLGRELRDILTGSNDQFEQLLDGLGDANLTRVHWTEARSRLLLSESSSIDEFLEKWPEHSDITKMAVAHLLSLRENRDALFSVSNNDRWYEDLLRVWLNDQPTIGDANLRIVTFNYDLSLELYLYSALVNRFRKTHAEAVAALDDLDVVHVHGTIGPIQPIDPEGRHYGPIGDARSLLTIKKSIVTCLETPITDNVRRAREHISNSEFVGFLGFGYSGQNLAYLNPRTCRTSPRVYAGSIQGCPVAERTLQPFLPNGSIFRAVGEASGASRTKHYLRELLRVANDDDMFS